MCLVGTLFCKYLYNYTPVYLTITQCVKNNNNKTTTTTNNNNNKQQQQNDKIKIISFLYT